MVGDKRRGRVAFVGIRNARLPPPRSPWRARQDWGSPEALLVRLLRAWLFSLGGAVMIRSVFSGRIPVPASVLSDTLVRGLGYDAATVNRRIWKVLRCGA